MGNKKQCYLQKRRKHCYGCCSSVAPHDDSCWARSYRHHLEGIAGQRGHQKGLMLQVLEEGGELGPGQREEQEMAMQLSVPIYTLEFQGNHWVFTEKSFPTATATQRSCCVL